MKTLQESILNKRELTDQTKDRVVISQGIRDILVDFIKRNKKYLNTKGGILSKTNRELNEAVAIFELQYLYNAKNRNVLYNFIEELGGSIKKKLPTVQLDLDSHIILGMTVEHELHLVNKSLKPLSSITHRGAFIAISASYDTNRLYVVISEDPLLTSLGSELLETLRS